MSEKQRQQQLAAAKKKLRQYRERNSLAGPAGAKKKPPKSHSKPETTTVGKSPEEARKGGSAPEPADNPPFPLCVPSPPAETIHTAPVEHQGADIGLNSMANLESLKHLSEKLTSLVSDTTLKPDRENMPCADLMDDLEGLYEGLAEALDICCKTNLQLAKKVRVLEQQNGESLKELETEKECRQKLLEEKEELRKDLQLHKETIESLVSQKNDLYTDLAHLRQAVNHKSGEMQGLTTSLQSSQLRVAELEAVLAVISSQQEEEKEHIRGLIGERDSLKMELGRTHKSMEELQEFNSRLEEHLQIVLLEKANLEHGMEELRKKLAPSNLLQVQCSFSPQEGQQAIEDREELEAEVGTLKEELEKVAGQLQAQLQVNETLSQQHLQQEEQLLAIEQASRMCKEQVEAHLDQLLETLAHSQNNIRAALGENQHLRRQLAELQDGFDQLSRNNQELSSTLQAEQSTKDHLAKQLEQLRQEVLQGRRDIHTVHQNLQQTQEQLIATRQQNQQLQAQMGLLAVPGGSPIEENREGEAARLPLAIPENVESREDMLAFFSAAQSSAVAEKAQLGQQLRHQKLCCQYLAQLAAFNHTRPEQEGLAPPSGGDCISQEIQGILQHLDKLSGLFKEDLQVKVFLKERMEDLELLFMQLGGEVDSMGDDTAFCAEQLLLLEKRQREKEEHIAQLEQHSQCMLLQLQGLLWELEQGKVQAASQSPPAKPTSGSREPLDSESACEEEFEEVNLNTEEEPVGRGTWGPSPRDKSPVQRIEPVLPDFNQMRKEEEEEAGSGSHCIPFFYRPAKDDHLDILAI
ncbi:golgin subfamily A member 2-like [Thomomys bottae]